MRLRMPACCPGSFPVEPGVFCGDGSLEEDGGIKVEALSPEGVRAIDGLLLGARIEGYNDGFARMTSKKRM